MPKQPRTIAGIHFPTQKAAAEHCQDLVQRWYAQRKQRNPCGKLASTGPRE